MKTTKQQFQVFKKEFIRIQKKLGLMDWDVFFMHKDTKNAYASIEADPSAMAATVFFSIDLPDYAKDDLKPKEHARHEAFHLLISKLEYLARWRYINENQIYIECEAICNRLEEFMKESK